MNFTFQSLSNEPKIFILGWEIPTRTCGKPHLNRITPRSHTPSTIFNCITEPQSRSASGPQMLAGASSKCVSSDAQVARRCTKVTQPAPILASVSYMYRRCIAGVSQVYLKCNATFSQPSRTWIRMHAIECAHCSQIWFRLESDQLVSGYHVGKFEFLPFHLVTSKMGLVS